MANKRVHTIAKETGVTSKEVMSELKRMGIEVKSSMKSLDPDTELRVVSALRREKTLARQAEAKLAETAKKVPAKAKKPAAPVAVQEKPVKKKAPAKAVPPKKKAAEAVAKTPAPAKPAPPGKAEPKPQAQKPAPERRGTPPPRRDTAPRRKPAPPRGGQPQRQGQPQRPPSRPQTAAGGRPGKPPRRMQDGRIATPGRHPGQPRRPGQPRHPGQARHPGQPRHPGRHGVKRGRMKDRKHRRISPQDLAPAKPRAAPPTAPVNTDITITEAVNMKELAAKMGIRLKDVMQKLMQRNIMVSLNQSIDPELAVEIAQEFGVSAEVVSFEEDLMLEAIDKDESQGVPRHPVVTVMGHVDHGKTSLLDAIRKTNIISTEAGGITQHIGAYHVKVGDKAVIFLDTPGHEAFTRMRSRGAQVTDLVILVVAADDGVMPQTVEAINHAKAASVPIMVAINKMDKPGANPNRIKQQLTEHGILTEDIGGETVAVEISAKKGDGIPALLEMILLVTDIQEAKANPSIVGMGTVLEAKLDKGRGPVATVLIQDGTVRVGDYCIAGAHQGKVRALFNDLGEKVERVLPSHPVQILGLQGVPEAGDSFQVVKDPVKASKISTFRQTRNRDAALAAGGTPRLTMDDLYRQMQEGVLKELPLILKGDVQGSVEVLRDAVSKLVARDIKPKVIHAGVGAVTEYDVLLASASNAIIIGFNVRPEKKATEVAAQENVDIRLHNVVYKVTEEITLALQGLLEPEFEERILGRVEVRDTFRIPRLGMVAGSYVTEGTVTRNAGARLLRDNIVVYEGKISSLRRFKDDVAEVKTGFECGIGLENYDDIKVGDVIEAFVQEQVPAKTT